MCVLPQLHVGQGQSAMLRVHLGISSKHLETPGDVLHEGGRRGDVECAQNGPCTEQPPAPNAPKAQDKDEWIQLSAWPERAFVSLWSPQHGEPSTQGGGGLHPLLADVFTPNICLFFPGLASLSIPEHLTLLEPGNKTPGDQDMQHHQDRWTETRPGWKEQAALTPK